MDKSNTSRREFMKKSGSALIASGLGLNVLAARSGRPFDFNADTIKVGLIGCGGRGTGAAYQATMADDNVVLTAMADLFQDRLDSSYKNLMNENPDKIKVEEDMKFVGFDSYKKVLASDVDVVLLATPPNFRPGHLAAAIEAGKHIFCEKPVAVDAPGVRSVIESAKKAKEKGLALMSGFCWRHDVPKIDTYNRILDGAIGNVHTIYNTYNTGALWFRDRQPDWSDLEYKMRNWLYYNWMSGDHIVEQAIHSIDLMSWAMGDELPVSASGTGGRQSRTEDQYGNVYDHFAIVYEYGDGRRGYHFSRQQKDTARAYGIDMMGDQGRCNIDVFRKHEIIGKDGEWNWDGKKSNMYQNEHNTLFASIRKGEPFNDGVRMANSTMLAIWGRMVAYTGQTISWEDALNSDEQLGPDLNEYSWDMDWKMAEVAQPGITKFS
ncbi:Gfo/Idh/MocA family protein [Flavilitoribacter nigricans]|uniref:Oxidoreductase n=1 Tax=Flavilitoribacter nigricans (strain ATCC 23147 / DSM 23189 / NBRC 102662 / NCIMB 1420 / SS-2) TaxID=1122177 RepID=A0A2D0NC49_FLAN2|nr:Gfo/Idh/MocA family oxidoreductase [Flavilitoribacter nigricans]PHN06084.1 oxidoreductase [Flavilitoribacter nigricans DSM 23189 = NBRC 102662]